jgi:sulfite reductase (NADPH) flavoprotein alpha-component
LNYEAGDCLGIYPINSIHQVDSILHSLKANGEELVYDREQSVFRLRDFLLKKANISRVTKKLATLIRNHLSDETKKAYLSFVLEKYDSILLSTFLDSYEIADFLLDYPLKQLPIQEFCTSLPLLLPRLYSIASSMKIVGKEAHLIVGLTKYERNQTKRLGVCTTYLCHTLPIGKEEIATYHHPANDFKLSEDSFTKPMIMIGPGTGIAPFMGFLQERFLYPSAQRNWLFFGERHRMYDFYYENELKQWVKEKRLKLDVAFSRDQETKVYVQHKMLENASELWQWLQEGAYLFICGDAKRMAKDVEQTLLEIFISEGRLSQENSRLYLKELKKQKRYLKDVY